MIAQGLSSLALLLCWPFAAAADVAVPPLSGRVVDQTGTLSATDIAALTQRLKDLETRKGSQVAVLIVPTTQPETIEQFSIRVAEAWKIGRKKIDDGALLVVAKNDHKLRIEVGYGLEGALTDVTSRRIIDEIITPRFKTGDFAGGISAGVDRIIRVIDGEPLPAPKPEASHGADPDMFFDIVFSPFGFLGYAAIAAILRGFGPAGRLRRHRRRGRRDRLVSSRFGHRLRHLRRHRLLPHDVRRQHSGREPGSRPQCRPRSWRRLVDGSSGSSWSGGSSSGSSDSGFSGGGGSFGGGGASGSW